MGVGSTLNLVAEAFSVVVLIVPGLFFWGTPGMFMFFSFGMLIPRRSDMSILGILGIEPVSEASAGAKTKLCAIVAKAVVKIHVLRAVVMGVVRFYQSELR